MSETFMMSDIVWVPVPESIWNRIKGTHYNYQEPSERFIGRDNVEAFIKNLIWSSAKKLSLQIEELEAEFRKKNGEFFKMLEENMQMTDYHTHGGKLMLSLKALLLIPDPDATML